MPSGLIFLMGVGFGWVTAGVVLIAWTYFEEEY